MKRCSIYTCTVLAAAISFTGTLFAQTSAPTTTGAKAHATLREAAGDRMLIGAAIMSRHLDEPAHAALIAKQFNCLTGENEFKPTSVHPQPAVFNFEPADKIVAFAQSHDMKMIGHTLLWHNQTPRWMFVDAAGKPLPREKALENLRLHIDTVVKHFKGRVIGWDVVNEAIPDGEGDLRDSPARVAIGDDYIEQAFAFAHAADPEVELYYNDYSIENKEKREKTIKIIRRLKEKGIRIDGVGIQGHWGLDQDTVRIDDAIKAFQAEGVKVMITELDISAIKNRQSGADVTATEAGGADPYKAGLPDNVQQQLAANYAKLFRIFKERGVTRVTFWGTHDGVSWLNDWPVRGRTNHPLLFDRHLNSKPAFDAVLAELQRE